MKTYYGIYSHKYNIWMKNPYGEIIFYPDLRIAKAHAEELSKDGEMWTAVAFV